ncbi:hypothetical protein ABEB36_005772 [Hypothenemus hampei]|uniref:sphingomyelin phosphodiesterase n=1 Tax=Hypothenemus hampei TaxID=57062 RepID=A0ABD1EZD9_HYPHA
MSLDFKIFTLNCWGLRFVSKNLKSRIYSIAEQLSDQEYDVVCLQELWTNRDFHVLKKKLHSVLPYAHYFYSGVVGSGICIFSKHPIEETFFHQWSVNGYIHKLHHGDWWGGKGVGLCRLRVDKENTTYYVNVYTTHLHAEYNRTSDDYQAHRILQAYDTAQFILLTSGSADLVVLAGDLNTEPGDLAYRIILTVPGLRDAYLQDGCISEEKFATYENLRNSYTPSSLLKEKIIGKRIDYVMYHAGSNVTVSQKNYCLPLPDHIPDQCYSYSDHEAILVELAITRDVKSGNNSTDDVAKKAVLEESLILCEEALKSISRSEVHYWVLVLVSFILLLVILIIPSVITTSFFDNFSTLMDVLKVLITIFLVFFFLMAFMWSRIETHGILSGKLAIEVSLRKIKNNKNL